MKADQVTEVVVVHGEGPVWSPSWGGLRFVDMLAGLILTLGADGSVTRTKVGEVAAALRPRRAGGAVLAIERGFALADADGTLTGLGELWTDPIVRMNDGGCDPDGRFYCGNMEWDGARGQGILWRIDADLSVHQVLDDLSISNGLEWTPEGHLAYFADTPTQRIDVFDYTFDNGLANRRPAIDIPTEVGSPDGLTVDAEGGVWVALWGGSAVHRYLPDGRLDEVVEVPASQVTACTFGGPNLAELFITTSRRDIAATDEPLAGAVFRAQPGVQGQPAREFAA
jgi:sugar lactone lactonase YvrE